MTARIPEGDAERVTFVYCKSGVPMRFAHAAHLLLEREGHVVARLSRGVEIVILETDGGFECGLRSYPLSKWLDVEIWQ